MKVGVIAEDDTDIKAVRVLINRIASGSNVRVKGFAKDGKSKIRSKGPQWAHNLYARGCRLLIIVNDLDSSDGEQELRQSLNKTFKEVPFSKKFICIPVQEMEAWFISDPGCIKKAYNLTRLPKFPGLPESIDSPKEKLKRQVKYCSNGEKFFMTRHNDMLAEVMTIETVISKCESFKKFHDFVTSEI